MAGHSRVNWEILGCAMLFAQSLVIPAGNTGAAEPTVQLEEIKVTATRREERAQDIPVSVTAYSQDALNQAGLKGPDDLFRVAPGVTFQRGPNILNSQSSTIAVRGVVQTAGASTTGIYLDDTPIQNRLLVVGTYPVYPAMVDLERVEVLRGPQGTLFGASSEGGNVRFILPQPSLDTFSGFARAETAYTQNGDPSYEVGAAVGGPIAKDRVGIRLSASYRRNGGYIDRYDWRTAKVVDANSNWDSVATARIALSWAPTDNLLITPSLYYQRSSLNDQSFYWTTTPDLPIYGQFQGQLRNGAIMRQPSVDKFYIPALKLDWDLGAVRLVSSTSYFRRDQSSTIDFTNYVGSFFLPQYPPDGSPLPTAFGDTQNNFTQEFRLESKDEGSPLKWTVGVFYQRAKEGTVQNIADPTDAYPPILGPNVNGYIFTLEPYYGIDTQRAVFGQVNYRFANRLEVGLGVRVSRTSFVNKGVFTGPFYGVPFGDVITVDASLKATPVTPKAEVKFAITDENMVYASVAKGFRIGGVNYPLPPYCTEQPSPTYKSDSVWSYEIGSKNLFADRRAIVNASAYYIDWRQIQQQVVALCGISYFENLGKARSLGFDLETEFKISSHTSLGLTATYTNAEYQERVERPGSPDLPIVEKGQGLPVSPYTVGLWGQYSHPAFGGEAYGRVDYQFNERGKAASTANPKYADIRSPARNSFTNVRAGLRWDHVDVSLFVQNLTNTQPRLRVVQDIPAIGTFDGTPLFYNFTERPRTIGLTANYRF